MNQIQLLTLLRPRDVRGQERVHERLEVRPPPLRQRIAHLPLVVDGLAAELGPDGREAFVETRLESGDLFVLRKEVIAWSVRGTELALHGRSEKRGKPTA